MKKKFKFKVLSILMAMLMVATIIPMGVISSFAVTANSDFDYSVVSGTDKTAEIMMYKGAGGAVTIPSTIDGYKVTSIGDDAFRGCKGLTSVIIPDSVTSIGGWAFYVCSGLTSIIIPDSVTSIGSGAFEGCTGLTAINVSEGNMAYSSIDGVLYSKDKTSILICPNGKSGDIIIPNSVTSIKGSAFCSCAGLTSIAIPDSVTSIGDYAFAGCTGLTSVTIPDSVTSIGKYAFHFCRGLKDATIGNSVTSIESGAFEGCTGLTSVTIPDSVTRIERDVFRSCTSLTSVTIGNSVTNIGSWAFDDCTGLKGITIPDSVTSIGKRAFGYYFDGNNAVKVDGFTITGTKGSAAEKYATSHGFNFIDIETIPNAKNNIIIKRVEQYASTSNDEELQNIMKTTDFNDTQQFNKFADYVNKAELSFKERMDYNFLINNEIYVAWQFKEYAQTQSVRNTFGLGNLAFNDDISQIITGNFPEKEKYKDGLKKYIEISNENFESVEYIKDTYSFLSDLSEATGEVKKKNAIKDLGKKVKQCKTKKEVDKLLKQFDYNATLGNISFDYKNEVLAKSLGLAGDVIECAQITAEGIVNLMSVAQNYSTYQRYIEMFNTIKACKTLPSALRVAAYELSEDLYNQYINAIEETTRNVAEFVLGKVLDLTLLGANVLLGSIMIGLSIGKFIGNVFLGVGEMLNASAYLECYVRIAEMYAEKLKQDKIAFNSNKTEKNAQQFKDDYDALYKFRLIGEQTYLEMYGYEKVWSNTTKFVMRQMAGYYEKKIFVNQNISSIMEKEFSIIDDDRKATIPLRKTYSNMVTVACPVNVLVYNKENVLVGKIINDIVDSSVNDNAEFPLVTYVSENTKVIMLPNESDYRIEIEATDDGKMAYSSTKFSSDKSVEKKTNYYDVNLQKDSKFVVNSLSDGKIDYDSLYLTENNVSKEIKPDEVILKNNIEENSVYINVTLNENGFISGKTKYVKGDCAELNILPKKGFYISSVTLDGKNIELNDGLLVIDNITKNHKVNVVFGMLGDVTGDGRVTSGDAIAVLRAEAQLRTLTAEEFTAADVVKDGRVTSGDAIRILRYEAQLVPSL